MTDSYQQYRGLLLTARDLPAQTARELTDAERTYARATQLAAQAVDSADAAADEADRQIQAELTVARTALEPLGQSTLIPPRIRPSDERMSATRADIAGARNELAAAVESLRRAVAAQIRHQAEQDRLAREAAERERAARDAALARAAALARRRRLIICVAIVLVVILTVAILLLTR